MLVKSSSKLPHVPIKFRKFRISALVDSGSEVSLMSETLLDRLNVGKCKPTLSSKQVSSIIGVGSSKVSSVGTYNVEFNLAGLRTSGTFVVVPDNAIPSDVLLGCDYLKANKVELDFGKEHLKIKGNRLDFVSCEENVRRVRHLFLVRAGFKTGQKDERKMRTETAHDCVEGPRSERNIVANTVLSMDRVVLPPRHKAIISARVQNGKEGALVLLEPENPIKFGVHIARTLMSVKKKGEILVKLVNTSNHEIHLEKNTKLGSAVPAEVDENLSSNLSCGITEDEADGKLNINESLCSEDQGDIRRIIKYYSDAFLKKGEKLPAAKVDPVNLELIDNPTFGNSKFYRVPVAHQDQVKKQLSEMQDSGIIEPAFSSFNSPLIAVAKSNSQELRIVNDFRGINENLKPCMQALPRIDDALARLGKAKYFTRIDLRSAFLQIPLNEKSRHITAFNPGLPGMFRTMAYTRLPQGIKVASNIFQHVIELILSGLSETEVLAYIDDILIMSEDIEQHKDRLGEVLERLETAGLKANLAKCFFAQEEIEFLGFIVSRDGVRPSQTKMTAFNNRLRPGNKKEVRSLIGVVNFYRRHIPKLSSKIAPLVNLTKKGVKFVWDEACEDAFHDVLRAMKSPVVLAHANYDKPFILTTDASCVGIGSVLSQVQDDGQERPISFYSRKLSDTQGRYSTFEREALAVSLSLKNFRSILLGRHFTVRTDNKALTRATILNANNRIAKMLADWSEYDFDIVHLSGVDNVVADYLSRQPEDTMAVYSTRVRDDEPLATSQDVSDSLFDVERLKNLQRKDPILSKIIAGAKRGEMMSREGPAYFLDEKKLLRIVLEYKGAGRKRYFEPLVIPKEMQREIVKSIHAGDNAANHAGVARTLFRCKERVAFSGLPTMVRKIVRSCRYCQIMKGNRQPLNVANQSWPTVDKPMSRLSLDVVGPMQRACTGERYILIIVDHFSRYAFGYPTHDCTADTITACFRDFTDRQGGAREVLTDRGSCFISESFTNLIKERGMKSLMTCSYNPQSNSVAERLIGSIKKILYNLVHDDVQTWPDRLQQALFLYNTSVHRGLGDIPFFLYHGFDAYDGNVRSETDFVPFNYGETYQQEVQNARARVARQVNKNLEEMHDFDAKRQKISKHPLRVGELILIQNERSTGMTRSLRPKYYDEVHRIVSIFNQGATIKARSLETGNERVVTHRRVKRYFSDDEDEIERVNERTEENDDSEQPSDDSRQNVEPEREVLREGAVHRYYTRAVARRERRLSV
ncbi:hypothetical protein SNEBB_009810 [Seison nebaliae]|nr:hypothetical protein SNEBB_009810 [Seison nebaliae]